MGVCCIGRNGLLTPKRGCYPPTLASTAPLRSPAPAPAPEPLCPGAAPAGPREWALLSTPGAAHATGCAGPAFRPRPSFPPGLGTLVRDF